MESFSIESVINEAKRVLVLSAHADDCEFFAGGMVALFAEAGAEVIEVIATDNARGSLELTSDSLVSQSRDIEAKEAAEILGKSEINFLGYPDGFLDDTPKNELRRIAMEWIRKVRPDVLLSFDMFAPFETHPDHRILATAVQEACDFAHMPLYHPEQIDAGLPPYMTPYRFWFAKREDSANIGIDISSVFEKKFQAIMAHKSQIRMMIDSLAMGLKKTGVQPELLPMLNKEEPIESVRFILEKWGRSIAEQFGLDDAIAEAFRLELAEVKVDITG